MQPRQQQHLRHGWQPAGHHEGPQLGLLLQQLLWALLQSLAAQCQQR